MPMIATTIISSMRVKPCWIERFMKVSFGKVGGYASNQSARVVPALSG
jgi:hypothetical protein